MAYNIRNVKINRTDRLYTQSRYGISFQDLTRYQKRLLIENPIIKDRSLDDNFLYSIFKIFQKSTHTSPIKIYWDNTTDDFVNIEKLKENYSTIDWACALSGKPIKAKIDNFDLENFVHPEYHDALLAPMVDSRILKSSIEFRKHIKKLLLNQQKEFLYHARKNSKINLE